MPKKSNSSVNVTNQQYITTQNTSKRVKFTNNRIMYVIVFTDFEVSTDTAKLPFTSSQDESSCHKTCWYFSSGVLYLGSRKTIFFYTCTYNCYIILYFVDITAARCGKLDRVKNQIFFFLCKFPEFYNAPIGTLIGSIFADFKICKM